MQSTRRRVIIASRLRLYVVGEIDEPNYLCRNFLLPLLGDKNREKV